MRKDCSIILALIALVLSFISLFGIHCKDMCVSEVVLTLLGICATVIVGISVVNSLELLQMSRRLSEIDNLQKEVETTRAEMEKLRSHANLALHVSNGLAFMNWKPKLTITECLKGLSIALQENDAHRADTCLDILEDVLKKDTKRWGFKTKVKDAKIDITGISDSYKDSKLFGIFKSRIESVFKSINELRAD